MESITALENLRLVTNGQMTNAGAWLLAGEVTKFIPTATIVCAVFRGKNKDKIIDRKEYSGDLYSNFENCLKYIEAKLNTALIPHARGRYERLDCLKLHCARRL